ncbi:predicted protein [Arabidopsis lyrata subsp. lyrata]|uniref:Predicted protein n=1 Tax=Arabidopsis lyrata subsp. lyrata TaxID=81972 RepID=D7LHH6_ARALL|nr:predicted protein [Arabidopsis lyrata subsp. lyrata]
MSIFWGFYIFKMLNFSFGLLFPFSEPFTVDPENPPPEQDYNEYFKNLKDGITGKEAFEQSTVQFKPVLHVSTSSNKKLKAAKGAFDTSLDNGIDFFDTAEVYGSKFSLGVISSETLLGRFIRERKERFYGAVISVASKFAALPWRLGRENVITALKDSLSLLELSSVDLYQLHWYVPNSSWNFYKLLEED